MQGALMSIPEDKGKHTNKLLDCWLDSPLTNSRKYHFGIGMAAKPVPPGLELLSDCFEVVNLSVEHHRVAPTRGEHRLVSFHRKVENSQPPKSQGETDLRIHPSAKIVRAAMNDLLRHSAHACAQLRVASRAGI